MQPRNVSVTTDGDRFNTLTAQVEFTTHHDGVGMPLMGTIDCTIVVHIGMHDDVNMPFSLLQKL